MHITVQGEASERLAPTRATVTAIVQAQDADPAAARAAMKVGAQAVHDSLTQYDADPAHPLESWSQGAPTSWTERPWGPDGKQGDAVFYAQTRFTAVFSDFDAVSQWMDQNANVVGVEFPGVSWGLSALEEETVTSRVRSQAVHNAQAKALAYARAAEHSSVHYVEIADIGLLGSGSPEVGGGPMRAAAKMEYTAIRPDDITISAAVHARFEAQR